MFDLISSEENAPNLSGFDGGEGDTLAELRRNWGREIHFPADAYYTVLEIAGNYAAGIWIEKFGRKPVPNIEMMSAEADKGCKFGTKSVLDIELISAKEDWEYQDERQQGKFVADLRKRPLEPIKVKWEGFRELTYSQELDFYAAIYSTKYSQEVIGGKDPARVNDWLHLTHRSMSRLGGLYWLGETLCTGDEESILFLTMNERRCQNAQRFILSTSNEECQFAADGLGRIFAQRHRRDSILTCYEKNDLNLYKPLRMKGYDAVGNSIPVPGTPRLLMIRETWGDSGTQGTLFDLDMDTGCCKIVPLPGMGEHPKVRPFTGDWVLISNSGSNFRTDFARLWNQQTGEVLRIRRKIFGPCEPDQIAALPDGRVIIITRNTMVGSILYEPEDFWGSLRSVNKPKKLGKWLCYDDPYPDIPNTLPIPKRKTCKYKLPRLDEPVLKFKNLNFKLAVMNVLMYEKNLLAPRFSIWEFADEYACRKIDPETEGYDSMVPEAVNWFRRYPIPARLAPEVAGIDMDGGDEVNCQLAPNWDGEDGLFDINAIDEAELRQFQNLKRASIFTANERAVVPVFRKYGIETVSAYDVPFQMDEEEAD